MLLHHDGIGPGRHGRTGKNPGHLPGLQSKPLLTGGNALGHRQFNTHLLQIGRAHRVTVHRRIVKGRHLQSRHHVLRQDAAIGIECGHRFIARQGTDLGQKRTQSLIKRHQRGANRCVHLVVNRNVAK